MYITVSRCRITVITCLKPQSLDWWSNVSTNQDLWSKESSCGQWKMETMKHLNWPVTYSKQGKWGKINEPTITQYVVFVCFCIHRVWSICEIDLYVKYLAWGKRKKDVNCYCSFYDVISWLIFRNHSSCQTYNNCVVINLPLSLWISDQTFTVLSSLSSTFYYLQSIIPSRLSACYTLKHLIHLYTTGLRLLLHSLSCICPCSQGRCCVRWWTVQHWKVKVRETGNTVWSQVDNSVRLCCYRQSEAAQGPSTCTQSSAQSPRTQTERGGEG